MKKILILFFLLAQWAAPAAAALDEQGAAALKQLIERDLLWRNDLTKISGHGPLIGGVITVTPKPAFYEVKIPDLSVYLSPQEKLNVGTVTVNAVPGKDGEWMTSVALPAAMTITTDAGAPLASITLGTQRFAGAWVPAQEAFLRFDSLYQNILVKMPAEGVEMSIGALKAMMNVKDNKDNTWSGPGSVEANDVKVSIADRDAVHLNIRKISAANAYDRLDLTRKREIGKKIEELAAAGQTPAGQRNLEFINGLISGTQGTVDNFRNTFTAEGIFLRVSGDPAKNIPAGEYALEKMTFEGNLRDGRREKSTASFKGGFDGVKLPDVPGDLAGLTPQTLNIALNVDSLPLQEITAMMFDSLQKSLETIKDSQDTAEAQVQAVFSAAMQMLQKAGTTLSIQDTRIKSRDMESSLAGQITADPTAALGAAGKITLSVKGLDETMLKLQEAAARPGADARLKDFINGLTVMMMLGQSEKTANRKTVYTYSFDIKNDAETLLKGIGGLQPGASPQQTPIPPAAAPAP